MAPQQLSDLQRTVLEWVNSGCPEDSAPSGNYKISARSLEGYELVKIKGHGDAWTATITERGKRVLTGTEPLRPKKKKKTTVGGPATGSERVVTTPNRPATPYRPRVTPTVGEAQQLLAAIEGAHRGFFRVKCSKEEFEREWEPRLKAAQRVAQEKQRSRRLVFNLKEEGWNSWWPTHVQAGFVDEVVLTESSRLLLSGERRVSKLHPMVALFTDKANFDVSAKAAPRARRLLHVLFTEAERIGWEVNSREIESRKWNTPSRTGVYVAGREITVTEQTDKVEREPIRKEKAELNRYNWDKTRGMEPVYDHVPNGLLTIEMGWNRVNDTKRNPRRLDTALATRMTQTAVERFFTRCDSDFKREAEASWQRRKDHAAEILRVREGRAFELETLRRQASIYREHQGLLAFVSELEGTSNVDADYLAWCKHILERENPVPVLAVPQVPELDREVFKEEIVEVAGTLDDSELDVWTQVGFDGAETSGPA
ncbi:MULTISPECIES: hypothetical protein [unclassified Corynebacterium]|uniref:hypothetical protein n=1 Tax=unclassified Corynebacterium TaxID=2624378 RepID=UPI0008A2EED5|nr:MULTISPECIES: hypothetical protein [unclassified Corynebacterium]OFK69065.1 hypothetical protein HMPREF2807_03390 [Corynebacterium sp. HMSC074A09]OHO58083.1 hypothetical protein HMPREF2635_00015 [Corynebacterium sp. HMSC035E02]